MPEYFSVGHAKDVVSMDGKVQNQRICPEFPGRKPFQIHVGSQFAMELLGFSMCMIKFYLFPVDKTGVCPSFFSVQFIYSMGEERRGCQNMGEVL